jgi:stage V sporulation protein S
MGEIIRVAAKSQPRSVAASIANTIREHPCAEVQAIGVDALNQMVKAAIIARRYLVQDHFDIRIVPDYANVIIDGRQVTALKFYIQRVGLINSHSGEEALSRPIW